MQEHGIGTDVHYPIPPYRQKSLQSFFEGRDFPISDEIHATTLSLPMSTAHTIADVDAVVDALNCAPV
jgi:dTDP-4-amino-4,6-dideoxygalactose transaminase